MTFFINVLVGFSALWCIGMNDPAKNPGTYQDYVLNQLNPDCYYNWAIYSEDNLKNPKFTPMLWYVTENNLKQAVKYAETYKGRTWLIYNEPEGSDQANTKPEVAAEWFDKAYTSIKSVDQTATIACCGVMIRNEGIRWLDTFVKNVKNKPDVWHIHVYVNANNFNVWKQFADYWWYWNSQNGNLPTYITETCAMYQEAQEDLMVGIMEYSHPLLKRIYWFSAYPEPIVKDWVCNLLNPDGDLVGLGDIFQNRQYVIPNKLTPQPVPFTPTPTNTPTKTPEPTKEHELTKTPEATKTPTPNKTPTVFPTITPTNTPYPTLTPTPNPDETTGEIVIDEPTIMFFDVFLPIVNN